MKRIRSIDQLRTKIKSQSRKKAKRRIYFDLQHNKTYYIANRHALLRNCVFRLPEVTKRILSHIIYERTGDVSLRIKNLKSGVLTDGMNFQKHGI